MLALPDELTRLVTASLLNNSARYSQNAFTFHDFVQYYVYYPRHVLRCLVRHLGFHGRKEPGVEVKNKWPIQSSRTLADHFARAQFCRLFHRFFFLRLKIFIVIRFQLNEFVKKNGLFEK